MSDASFVSWIVVNAPALFLFSSCITQFSLVNNGDGWVAFVQRKQHQRLLLSTSVIFVVTEKVATTTRYKNHALLSFCNILSFVNAPVQWTFSVLFLRFFLFLLHYILFFFRHLDLFFPLLLLTYKQFSFSLLLLRRWGFLFLRLFRGCKVKVGNRIDSRGTNASVNPRL